MTHRMILIGVTLLLGGAAVAQSPLDALTANDLAEGKRLFELVCSRCHGIAGEGGEGHNLAKPRLRHAPNDEALMAVILNGIPGTGMPEIWMLESTQIPLVAGYVKTLGEIEAEEMPGNPERGADIYQTSGGCPACHIVSGRGLGIGPELTYVGDRSSLDYLRQSLEDPAIAQSRTNGFQDYLTVRATSATGQVEGVRINEDAFSIQIRDISGVVHSISKDELQSLEKLFAHSLMPEYGAALTQQDEDDLVSYLMSLRSDL